MKIVVFLLILISFQENIYAGNSSHIWKKDKIYYYLNKEANSQTERAVIYAFEKWSKETHFKFIYKKRYNAGLIRDGKNTISFLTKWPADIPKDKIAWCNNWYDNNGNIVESDIIFNMSVTGFTTLETRKKDSYFIEGVLVHEIGHLIGIGHIDNSQSFMKNLFTIEESRLMGISDIDNLTLLEYKKLYGIKE
jgi:hypothetical protein